MHIEGIVKQVRDFGATMMIAGNIAGRTQTIPIAIYSAVQGGDMETAYLWTAIISFAAILMIWLINLFEPR